MSPIRFLFVLGVLGLTAFGVFSHAVLSGEIPVSGDTVLAWMQGKTDSPGVQVIADLRAPRALAAFACGGLLAISGVLMQVFLRNPLADPYVLGVSGGAAVGALLAMLAGASWGMIEGSAFLGAVWVMVLVFGLAGGLSGEGSTRLLLTGVVLASACASVIALILTFAPPHRVPGMMFWLMGDCAQARHPLALLVVLALGLVLIMPIARELNVLAAGSLGARAVGVSVDKLQLGIYALSALLTAVSVSSIGSVGFVGLIVPHGVRAWVGADHRRLIPCAALAGGSLLTLADTFSRTLASPLQLPVGVLMSMIGVPAFLLLLAKKAARG